MVRRTLLLRVEHRTLLLVVERRIPLPVVERRILLPVVEHRILLAVVGRFGPTAGIRDWGLAWGACYSVRYRLSIAHSAVTTGTITTTNARDSGTQQRDRNVDASPSAQGERGVSRLAFAWRREPERVGARC